MLPTGVTPITAVPTRIVRGPAPRATISFATGKPRTVEIGRLFKFAAEEGNPGNDKQVVDITVEVPSTRLAEGVCFVDTPGLGSLATAGAEQTLAYLPRCDVGVLLIDAAGIVTAEDAAVARAVLEAGAELLVLLSKADLRPVPDLRKVREYVRVRLATALGRECPVAPVSVVGEHGQLAAQWFERELAPRLRQRRTLAATSLRRKIGALRETVVAALRLRLQDRAPVMPAQSCASSAGLTALADARVAMAHARGQIGELTSGRARYGAAMRSAGADALAQAWSGTAPAQLSAQEVVAGALVQEADRLGAEFEGVLTVARRTLAHALAAAGAGPEAGKSERLPRPAGRIQFDSASPLRDADLEPGLLGMFEQRARRHAAARRMEYEIGEPLTRALSLHIGSLRRWAMDYLAALEQAFDAAAATVMTLARLGGNASHGDAREASPALVRDLEKLSRWQEAGDAVYGD